LPRNWAAEATLCDAVRRRVHVELQYDQDASYRLIAPYVVFRPEDGDVCLSCYQVTNPAKPQDGHEPRNFTVAKIKGLRLTERPFTVDPRFNRADAKYRNGVLCSV
jgi:hypothetical protein